MEKFKSIFNKYFIVIAVCLLTIAFSVFIFIDVDIEDTKVKESYVYDLKGTSFENIDLPDDYDIRQFEGMTLRFIVENNRHATILLNESQEFSELTGINIKIKPVDFDTLVQKINLDFIAKAGQYQIVYVDPYKTLNQFHEYLEVLNSYNNDIKMPHIQGFMNDFFVYQTDAISHFENTQNIYTIPFDSTTMILYYRTDIFDKYADQFYEDKGYDWTPGKKDFTWERYIEVAKWIDENVPDNEVKYGSGGMAQEHNSIFCEFSNILAAYGGDFFNDEGINTLGLESFESIAVLDSKFVKALDIYKEMIEASAPESVNWNWTDSANAFRNGEIAMMLNWDENYPYLDDQIYSKAAGNVGTAIMPYGDVRSANIFGGSGIGINKFATEEEKQAAWLYITWATSKEMQLNVLLHPEGGNLPTRKSVYEVPEIRSAIDGVQSTVQDELNIEQINVVLDAWKSENIYLRPKVSNFYDVEKVLIKYLHDFISQDLDSTNVSTKIYQELYSIMVSDTQGEYYDKDKDF